MVVENLPLPLFISPDMCSFSLWHRFFGSHYFVVVLRRLGYEETM